MRIAVAIATLGRQELLTRTAPLWLDQTRPFDRFILSVATMEDVAGVLEKAPNAEIIVGPKGSCAQRNRILDHLAGDCELVAFVDDDYIPSRNFLEKAVRVFEREPSAVAASGLVIDDGVRRGGITFEDGLALVQAHDARETLESEELLPGLHCYGCNMVVRVNEAPDLRFDERLPLYGWQEDLDYSRRLGRHGKIIWTHSFAGVHMGINAGRTSGIRLGYSQVANPLYLASEGKKTMRLGEAIKMISRNLAANLVRSFKPEAWVDRRGRLYGNVLAFADGLRGRLRPERILDL